MRTENKKIEYVNCNLCGSDNYAYINYEGKRRIVKCRECGLIYRNPRSVAALDRETDSRRVYGSYTEAEEHVSRARERFFRKSLNRLNRKGDRPHRRLLDIGCGQGHFLNLAKDSGWEVEGVEPVKSACDYARQLFGIEIKNKALKEAGFPEAHFDAVTLWNVLDHLPDPLEALKEIDRILKPGGILVIRVPNVSFHLFVHGLFSLLPSGIKSGKLRDPSIIINYGFSKSTISGLLKEAGFGKIRVYNSPLSYGDPYKLFKISERLTSTVKEIIYLISRFIFYLSAKRCIVGSSFLVYARK